MAVANIYHNYVPNCKVITPEGKIIIFNQGKCITTFPHEIKHLDQMVADGDAYVYVDPDNLTIDTEELTAEGQMAKFKRETIAAYIASQSGKIPDLGSNAEGNKPGLNLGTSATILNTLASNSAAVGEQVAPAPQVDTSTVVGGGVKVTAPAPSK